MARKRTDDDDDDRPEPKKTKKPDSAGGSNMLLIGGIGAILLLCCTCGGVGTGGWFLRDRFSAAPVAEKKPEPQANADDAKKDDARTDDTKVADDSKTEDKKPKGKKPTDKKGKPPSDPLGIWKEVRAEKGKFSIDLPVRSIDEKLPVNSLGEKFVQVAGSVRGHVLGVASTQRFGGSASQPAKTVAENNAQTPSFPDKKDITLQGHPGVERRSPDGKTLVRCYVTAERVYVITVTSQAGKFDQAVADRAFASFKILD
jgi:hypothetical protein